MKVAHELKNIASGAVGGAGAGMFMLQQAGEVKKEFIEGIKQARKEAKNCRQIFETVLLTLEREYIFEMKQRVLEAKRFYKEDWLTEHIGSLLKAMEGDDKEAREGERRGWMERLINLPHVEGLNLNDEDLRREWENPEKSEFLIAIYTLEEDKWSQFLHRVFGAIKKITGETAKSIEGAVVEVNKVLDKKLPTINKELCSWKDEWQKKAEDAKRKGGYKI